MHRQHAVHLGEVQADAPGHGQQVAFERRTGAVGNQRHAMLVAEAGQFGDFLGGVGEDHGVRGGGRERGFVAAMVGADACRGGKPFAEAGGQCLGQGNGKGTARQGGGGRGVVHAFVSGESRHSTPSASRGGPHRSARNLPRNPPRSPGSGP
ncbi:hypothetical protein D3C81_888860 [compost metagenome]